MAPALHGVVQTIDGAAGVPGCNVEPSPPTCIKVGINVGEENERR